MESQKVVHNGTEMTLGEYAYRVYAEHRLANQMKLLAWEKLPEYVRDAWEVTVAAVKEKE